MRDKVKMYYSSGLEYIVGSYSRINYFSRNIDDNYSSESERSLLLESQYIRKAQYLKHKNQQKYFTNYTNHTFTPEIFLSPQRPKTRFVDDIFKIKSFVEETFELVMKEKLPSNISINILPLDEFKALHSRFGSWNNGIVGFSINGNNKKIFVRENHLDALTLVIGHEIGHVLTETLPNKYDEEAKAFAFSIEWAKTIKKHNIANLDLSIKEKLDFQPARNGLHDITLSFVILMIEKGKKAIELHNDLVKSYVSIFNSFY